MSSLRRFFLWYALLSKRLLKRPAYLAVLLLIPLFAAAISLFSRQDSGVVTVALCLEDPADPAARAAADRLLDGESILRCLQYEDADAAREAVRSGLADAAWIFSPNFQSGLTAYVRYGSGRLITVVEREENVFLMLAREKLYAALYPELSFDLFRNYLVRELGAEGLTEEQLRTAYASGFSADELIRFTYVDGTEIQQDGRYLAAPLRGILALLLLLCGLSSGMYCYREEREESFVWLPERRRRLLPVLCHLTAMAPAALAVLAALYLGGLWLGLGREVLMMLLYLPGCALFCEILRCLSPREEHYGALIPILAVAVLVLCPVFVSLPFRLPFQDVLPTAWYLKASFSEKALLPMLYYCAALLPLWALCSRLRAYVLGRLSAKD